MGFVKTLTNWMGHGTPTAGHEKAAEAGSVPLEDGLIHLCAEAQLAAYCERLNQAPAGWLGLYLKPEPGFEPTENGHWFDMRMANIVKCQVAEVMNATAIRIFLLSDFSCVILAFGKQMRKTEKQLVEPIQHLLYDNAPLATARLLDLSVAWNTLAEISKEKYQAWMEVKNQETLTGAHQAELDDQLLKLPEFSSRMEKLRRGRMKPVILLVEDDKATSRLVGALLKDYEVHAAFSANQAVELYYKTAPDVVFLDIGLPDVSGLEVLRSFRAAEAAKVVMLTANSSQANLQDALQSGAQGFIAKPFTAEKLLSAVNKLKKQQPV